MTRGNSTGLKWAEPPSSGPHGTKWALIAQELRDNPGRWALVTVVASATTAARIRRGYFLAFRPAGSFESHTHKTDKGFEIYARFVGEA